MSYLRLDNQIDDVNIMNSNIQLKKRPNYLNNDAFNTSNSLFVEENKELEQRLYDKYEKLNLRGDGSKLQPIPSWFQPKHNVLQQLGAIQLEQVKYPVVAEIPSNYIRREINNPERPPIDQNDITALRNLINSLAPPKVV